LGALGTTGLGLSALTGLAKASGENFIEIPTHMRGDEVAITKKVPQEWYSHVKHTRVANEAFQSKYLSQNGVKTIGRTRSDLTYGGRYGFQLRIEIDFDEFDGQVPNEFDGVPVEVIEYRGGSLGACEADVDITSNYPGGINVETSTSTCTSFGTTAIKVDVNNNPYMLTAAHLWDACNNNITGDSAYNMGDIFGTVDDYNDDEDWATIDSGSSLDDRIREEGGTRIDVVGHVNSNGVDDMITSGETVYKMGVTTGKEQGTVKGNGVFTGFDCVDFNGNGVETKVDYADGDSGGPVYDIEFGNAYIIHLNSWQTGSNIGSQTCHPTSSNCNTPEIWTRDTGIGFYHLNNSHSMCAWGYC